jgi:hypothetical protein
MDVKQIRIKNEAGVVYLKLPSHHSLGERSTKTTEDLS